MKALVKRTASVLLAVALLLCASVISFADDENAGTVQATDVYLVIDNSYSMEDTDPDKLVEECVKIFFQKSPVGSSAIGVITFSGQVENVSELVSTSDNGSVEDLGDLGYDQTGTGTDIGRALATAAAALTDESTATNPNKAIVLLTDGADNRSSSYTAVSYGGSKIPVYCVYINDGTNEDEESSRDYLNKVAEDTGTDELIEVTSVEEAQTEMAELADDVYYDSDGEKKNIRVGSDGGNPTNPGDDSTDPGDGSAVTTYEVANDIYEVDCTIEHDAAATLELTVTDPNGTVLYENGKTSNSLVTFVDTSTLTTLKLMWPDAGTYTFTFNSDKEQEIEFDVIAIVAELTLTLDQTEVTSGKSIEAVSTPSGTSAEVKTTTLNIHDSNGTVQTSSTASDGIITDNGDGTFTISTKQMEAGTYGAVAVADLSDGRQVASTKVNFTVKEKKNLILPIIVIIAVILVVLGLFLLIRHMMRARGDQEVYTRPCMSKLEVGVIKRGELDRRHRAFFPQELQDGKPRDLFSMLRRYVETAGGDAEASLPQELRDVNIYCMVPRNGTTEDQTLYISYAGEEMANIKCGDAPRSVRIHDDLMLTFKWTNGR